MRKSLPATITVLAALALIGAGLLAGCQQRGARTTRASVYQQPYRVNITGTYKHPASGMEFPPEVGEFKRTLLVRYEGGRSVSARYAIEGASSRIEATVYVYPTRVEPSAARAVECGNQLDAATTDFARITPNLQRTGTDDVTLDRTGTTHHGRRARFTFDEKVYTDTRPGAAEIYLFCNASDQWQVEYRFTHSSALDAAPIIDDFMHRLAWTLHAS
jgi:hypothetical protein